MLEQKLTNKIFTVELPKHDLRRDLLPCDEISSEFSTQLSDVRGGRRSAQEVRTEILARDSPRIERIGTSHSILTFALDRRGDAGPLHLAGHLSSWSMERYPFRYINELDLWVCSFVVPKDLVASYRILAGEPSTIPSGDQMWTHFYERSFRDPLNPKSITFVADPALENDVEETLSVVEPEEGFVWKLGNVDRNPGGTMQHVVYKSEILGNQRSLWLWTPRGVTDELNLIVSFDGSASIDAIPIPHICDSLLKMGEIPATAVLLIGNASQQRTADLSASPTMMNAVMKEFLPWAESKARITRDPARTIITGFSLGGYMSLEMLLRYPDRFGWGILQSPALSCVPTGSPSHELLTGGYGDLKIGFTIDVGVRESFRWRDREPGLLEINRVASEALRGSGKLLEYFEMPSAHDYPAARISFVERLRTVTRAQEKNAPAPFP